MRLRQKTVHIVKRPEKRVDVTIVADVIPIVVLRRTVHRAEPHNVHAKIRKIWQT